VSSALRREILFWLIAAVVVAGYVGMGHWLAPGIPREPALKTDKPNSLHDFIQWTKANQQRKEAIAAHNEFVRRWYQWGAGIGIVLILFLTWWRPPWREPASSFGNTSEGAGATSRRASVLDALPISRTALLGMLTTLMLFIAVIVVLAVVFG